MKPFAAREPAREGIPGWSALIESQKSGTRKFDPEEFNDFIAANRRSSELLAIVNNLTNQCPSG